MILVANTGQDIFLELGNFVSNHVLMYRTMYFVSKLGVYCVQRVLQYRITHFT